MHTLAQSISIKLVGILLAFLSLGLTFESNTKNDSEYTEVLHFRYEISRGDFFDSYGMDENLNPHPKSVFRKLPDDLNLDLANELFQLGYKRSEVRKRDFAKLDSIFTCEPLQIYTHSEYIFIYRDILIFRKRKKVIKIVQLCFDCDKAYFIGPWTDIKPFGQRGEFGKLKKLLEKK